MMIGGEGVGLWGEGTKSRPNLVKIKTLMMIHVETNLFFMAEKFCTIARYGALHVLAHDAATGSHRKTTDILV